MTLQWQALQNCTGGNILQQTFKSACMEMKKENRSATNIEEIKKLTIFFYRQTLLFLLNHLDLVLQHTTDNKMGIENLTVVVS